MSGTDWENAEQESQETLQHRGSCHDAETFCWSSTMNVEGYLEGNLRVAERYWVVQLRSRLKNKF